ncbi:restriction endonuclease [Dyella sp. 2HG41-7]|uniref:restriction endonuclease n=1 Tax=Dyella sp. 2HG41-7 TaxID=2883239 RepID=UPI001F3DADC8|nr:restriction endonuclease [Dyella sp. 2HG41-7]
MKWKNRNLRELADIICGNVAHFHYRSSSYITEFFEDCDLGYVHDGSTRWAWVADRLDEVLGQPHPSPAVPPDAFIRIIRAVLDKGEAQEGDPDRSKALAALNVVLVREGWEAFYDEHGIGQLRHIATNSVAQVANPHRPMTPAELERRDQLTAYFDKCSEDELIEDVLLPLFRQLGFHRITAAGHKDKALEYGKDVWMKYTLPTLHVLYFGIQVKKGKLDAAGVGKNGSANVAEIHNQVNMMLGHEIFDPELNRRVLVDHAFIVAGGEITKQARNWIGNKLDATKRSQIMFMDRDDLLNLFVVTNLPLPKGAVPNSNSVPEMGDDIPF